MGKIFSVALCALLAACVTAEVAPSSVVRELAPTGKLRVAINYGNSVLAQRGPSLSEPRGVSADLARELARRLRVPIEFVSYEGAGRVTADATKNAWDVGFVARDPKRAEDITFTDAYVIIEGGYLVPAGSPLQAIDDVDRDGVQIVVARGSAYDLFLSRLLKRATLVRAPTPREQMEYFATGKYDGTAGVKPPLVEYARSHPGLRVLPGRFMVIEQAMATPRGRPTAAKYLAEFVDEMKASGFVAMSLEKSGQKDAAVAP
jgi:polar amino acid transport system substrate-binding protein